MEKMMWAKPELNEVVFAANDSVSVCLLLTCTLMGEPTTGGNGHRPGGGGNSNPTYQEPGTSGMAGLHQYNQCGAGSSAGGAWFNQTTQRESGTNGARVEDVFLDVNGNAEDGYEFEVLPTTQSSVLSQLTTAVGAIWTSVLDWNNNTYYYHHVGTAVYQEDNANNS